MMNAARHIADTSQFLNVPRGTFLMGSTAAEVERAVRDWAGRLVNPTYTAADFRRWIRKEYPAHTVQVRPFRLARYPVTNDQYLPFAIALHYPIPESIRLGMPADHPVWGLDAAACDAFVAWTREETGLPVRLPTETEWEYAARGVERWQYPFGDEFDHRLCNTRESGHRTTTSVFEFARYASPFGVCDMAGNVEEFTASDYVPYPGGDFVEDHLTDVLGMKYRVLRGGSAELGVDLARVARRHGPYPQFTMYGFRLAMTTVAPI